MPYCSSAKRQISADEPAETGSDAVEPRPRKTPNLFLLQGIQQWAILDSNQGPLPYQERAGAGLRGSCPGFARPHRALRP
jgi:hypothetical protein